MKLWLGKGFFVDVEGGIVWGRGWEYRAYFQLFYVSLLVISFYLCKIPSWYHRGGLVINSNLKYTAQIIIFYPSRNPHSLLRSNN